jgi:L-ascorbate metabolism protein UlaG (beta-lactamase superfamily)
VQENPLIFRWLGTAGIELEFGGDRILIDPYLSRVPFRYLFFGRPVSDREVILSHLSAARAVLVTHPHFDHLMDVPVVCRAYGATAYGSPHTRKILLAHSVPPAQIRVVQPGDRFQEGPFAVEVFPAKHGRIAGILPHTGALPVRLNPPLRLRDFRMDRMYSYRITAGGMSVLLWNTPDPVGAPRADVLAIVVSRRASVWVGVIEKVRPKVVIPIHWDDFFSPLDRPLRPMLAPPRLERRLIQRMDPREFSHAVTELFPKVTLLIPKVLKWENLDSTEGES